MFDFMVTADGGLTTAGYVITIIAGIVLFFLAIYLAGKNSDRKKHTAKCNTASPRQSEDFQIRSNKS